MKDLPMSCTNVFSSGCPNRDKAEMKEMSAINNYDPSSPSDFHAANSICWLCEFFEASNQ